MTHRMKYLVIGAGSIARRHITNLKLLFANAEIYCVSASGRPVSAAETGADYTLPTLTDALEVKLQFAVIASPAPLHLAQASMLLKAGIPVLIEKPLASSLQLYK